MEATADLEPRPVAWRAERRGTPWFGHAIAGGGGALKCTIGFGAVMVGVALVVARLLREPSAGDADVCT